MSVDKIAAVVATLVVAVAIVAGLVIGGSPQEQRLKRLDSERISDLRGLARSIRQFANNSGSLPDDLAQLVDGLGLTRLPSDPVTDIGYDYAIVDAESYTLCAEFQAAAEALTNDFWAHDAGRTCFTFKINEPDTAQGIY